MMARYNAWENDQLASVLAVLENDEPERDQGAFFGSIRATLSHLVWGDRVWLCRFEGREPSRSRIDVAVSKYTSVAV